MKMNYAGHRNRGEGRAKHGDQAIALLGRNLLLACIIMVGISGCASPEAIDLGSNDPSYDQKTIAGFYRNQAIAMREKAHAQTTAAVRYEGLFGSDSDLVSGAHSLARYYEQTAKELDHLAEAHAALTRTDKHPRNTP